MFRVHGFLLALFVELVYTVIGFLYVPLVPRDGGAFVLIAILFYLPRIPDNGREYYHQCYACHRLSSFTSFACAQPDVPSSLLQLVDPPFQA